jgi:prepilin peptidase CpaA
MLERLPWITQILLAVIALVATYYDIRFRRIPNWLTLPGVVIGFVAGAILPVGNNSAWGGLANAALGFALAMLINFPLYLLHARGAGDVKLMAAIGALIGWRDWIAIFLISSLLGGLLAIVLMLGLGRVHKTLSNLWRIVVELVHLRSPARLNEELDVTSPAGARLPQGAVIGLACFALLGLHALLPH